MRRRPLDRRPRQRPAVDGSDHDHRHPGARVDHADLGPSRCEAGPRDHRHGGRREDHPRLGPLAWSAGHRQAERHRDPVAQPLGARRRAAVHRGRDRCRCERSARHREELVPNVHADPDVRDEDRRGLRSDLRRGDPDRPLLQPPGDEPRRGRARARDQDIKAGRRLVVLGHPVQHGAGLRVLPAQALLAAAHPDQLRRSSQRGAGRAGRLRPPHPHAVVRDRTFTDRRRQYVAALHERVPRREAVRALADQQRPPRRRHAQRHDT